MTTKKEKQAPRYVNRQAVTVLAGGEQGTYQAGAHTSELSHLTPAKIERLVQMGIYAPAEENDVSDTK